MGHSKRDTAKRSKERAGDGTRNGRLEELIREEVNFLLRSEVSDPRLESVVVTGVELMGTSARLWFTAEGDHDRVPALDRASGYFRNHLAESLGLKRTPELRFRRDPATRTLVPSLGEMG